MIIIVATKYCTAAPPLRIGSKIRSSTTGSCFEFEAFIKMRAQDARSLTGAAGRRLEAVWGAVCTFLRCIACGSERCQHCDPLAGFEFIFCAHAHFNTALCIRGTSS